MIKLRKMFIAIFIILLVFGNFSLCYGDVIVLPPQWDEAHLEYLLLHARYNKYDDFDEYIEEKAKENNVTVEEYYDFLTDKGIPEEYISEFNELFSIYYDFFDYDFKTKEHIIIDEEGLDEYLTEDGFVNNPLTFEEYQEVKKEAIFGICVEIGIFCLIVVFWFVVLFVVKKKIKQIKNEEVYEIKENEIEGE